MDGQQKSGFASHPGEPQNPSAGGGAAIGGGSAITADTGERSAASATAVMAPYGFPGAAPPPLASTAYAMGATPLSPYGYLPPPPLPQIHPSYYSGALHVPIPPPLPPQAAANTFPASFFCQQQMPAPPMPLAAATLVATQTMGTRPSTTTTTAGPAVSDSSEDSDSNIKEGAHKEDVAISSSSSSDSTIDGAGLGPKTKVTDKESKLDKAKTHSSANASDVHDGTAENDPADTGKVKSNSKSADDSDEKSTAYNSIDGSPMDDIQSLSSNEALDDNVGQRDLKDENPIGANAHGDPLLDIPSAIGSAVSSRAISPILGPHDFGGKTSASSPSNTSPRTAARASDREFSDDRIDGSKETQSDGDGSLAAKPKPAAMAVTKKEEDLPPLGQEQHLDEPEEFAWLRPLKCIQARGGNHDDPEKSMTSATVVSFPALAGELLDLDDQERGEYYYDEKAKWYIRIYWAIARYKQWLPCEWCREEFSRGERKRTTTNRYTTGAIAAVKRNGLLKKSAPQTHCALGSKLCPIDVDGDDNDDDGATEIPSSKRKLASLSRASQREENTQASQNQKRSRKPIVNSTGDFSEWEKDLVLFVLGGNHEPSPAASAEAAPSLLADNGLDICCECKQLEDPNSCIKMLLCDGCNAACHLPCTHDNLDKVPRNEWYCRSCWSLRESRRCKGRDDDKTVTFCEMQARLKQLEEENKELKHEVTAMKEAELVYQSELLELRRAAKSKSKSKSSSRSSPKKRRPSGGQSSAAAAASKSTSERGEAEPDEKRKRPKREPGDIALRHNLLLTFQVVDDERQSDASGCGVIARRTIKEGEVFEDRNVTYEKGAPPPSMDQWRYIALGSDARSTGYFRLRNSHIEMINQPLRGQEANVRWYCSMYQEEGRPARKVLRISALRDIQKGEEILVVYRAI